jgi:hypothetical protein
MLQPITLQEFVSEVEFGVGRSLVRENITDFKYVLCHRNSECNRVHGVNILIVDFSWYLVVNSHQVDLSHHQFFQLVQRLRPFAVFLPKDLSKSLVILNDHFNSFFDRLL